MEKQPNRILSFILTLALVIGSFALIPSEVSAAVGDTVEEDGINYKINEMPIGGSNGEVAVDNNQTISRSDLSIPTTINYNGDTYDVVAINNYAFLQNSNLSGMITIPTSVSIIGSYAFQETNISSLNLNEGLITIGDFAFNNVTKLEGTLTIPKSMTKIGDHAFENTSVSGLTLKEGLITIGAYAFNNTTKLVETLTIPNSVKSIGSYAFQKTNISKLNLNEGLETIGQNAFNNATKLEGTLNIPSSITLIGYGSFENTSISGLNLPSSGIIGSVTIDTRAFYNTPLKGTLTIPSTIRYINFSAFESTKITELVLPQRGLERINQNAFFKATSLGGIITIPSSVESIGDAAFKGTQITKLNLPTSGLKTIGVEAFFGVKTLTGSLDIPSSLTEIGISAFANTNITELNFPKYGQLKIGISAFNKVKLEGTLIIPSGVISIGKQAFGNVSVDKLILQSTGSLTIGDAAFGANEKLKTVEIQSNSIVFSDNVFESSGITKCIFRSATPPTLHSTVFLKVITMENCYYPKGNENAYSSISDFFPSSTGIHVQSYVNQNISSFSVLGKYCTINNNTNEITTTLPHGSNIKSIIPSIIYSGTISPSPNTARDFSIPQKYTVTNEAGDTSTYTVKLSVNPPPPIPIIKVNSVKTLPKLYIVKGKKATLPYIVYPENANNKAVTWKSANRKIASVSSKGVVKGLKAGKKTTITITTKDGKKTSKCTVYVVKKSVKLKRIILSKSGTVTLKKGRTLQLSAKASPSKTTSFIPKWKSSNSAVARVNKLGKVTAVKPGKAVITTYFGKKKDTVTIKVVN